MSTLSEYRNRPHWSFSAAQFREYMFATIRFPARHEAAAQLYPA
jgi:hypothetical protein